MQEYEDIGYVQKRCFTSGTVEAH